MFCCITSGRACGVTRLLIRSYICSLCAGAGSQHGTSSQHVPATSFLVFDAAPSVEGVSRRIRELSATLAAAPQNATQALADGEAASLEAMLSRYCLQRRLGLSDCNWSITGMLCISCYDSVLCYIHLGW